MFSKIKKLIKHPKKEYRNIVPYLRSRVFFYQKKVYEFFKVDKFSKPYPSHNELLNYIDKENGFFVECGGNDGFMVDPTYFLEKFRKWTGIIIEPLSVYRSCEINRKKSKIYNYALVSNNYEGKNITLIDCNAMTVVKGSFDGYEEWVKMGEKAQNIKSKEIIVPARTLNSILEEYNLNYSKRNIDLLVLDLEGYELNALMGFDIKKYKPKFVLIEIHKQERKQEIESYLGDDYILIDEIGFNDFLYTLK